MVATTALAQNRRLLSGLERISQSVTSHRDLTDLTETLAREIVEYGIFHSLTVAVVNPEIEEIEVTAKLFNHPKFGIQSNQEGVGERHRIDEDNPTAITAKTGVLQVREEWDFGFDKGALEDQGNGVAYFIPVRHGDLTVAVLATESTAREKNATIERIESLQPLLNEVGIAIAYARALGQLETSCDELADRAWHLHTLYELSASPGDDPSEQIRETLRLVTDFLSCKIGLVSRVVNETYTIEHVFSTEGGLSAGDVFPLEEMYSDLTLEKDEPVAIHHTSNSHWRDHLCYKKFNLETYIGVPLNIQGKRYGTLAFLRPGCQGRTLLTI